MSARMILVAIGLGALVLLAAPAPVQARESIPERAARLAADDDCYQALAILDGYLRVRQEDETALWLAGDCATRLGRIEDATDYLIALTRLRPVHLPTWEALVQLYQRAGRHTARDEARQRVKKIWREATDPATRQRASYLRDSFRTTRGEVLAFENFAFEGPQATRYTFVVEDSAREQTYRLALSSFDAYTATERTLNQLPEGERLFHLDAYTEAAHYTLAFFTGEPGYDEVRPMVRTVAEHGDPAAFATTFFAPRERGVRLRPTDGNGDGETPLAASPPIPAPRPSPPIAATPPETN